MNPMLSFEEVLAQLLAAATPVAEIEALPLAAARGRVLAEAQVSGINVPPHDNSAMDGYLVHAADLTIAGTRLPISQRIAAGSVGQPLQAGTAARIYTGAAVPAGGDCVVMQEECVEESDERGHHVLFKQAAVHGKNIRRAGEDIRHGDTVLAAGIRLLPQHLGLAASVGIARLPLRRRLKVALISTGDELTMPGEVLKPGAIYNTNLFVLHALLEQLGCTVSNLGTIPDELEQTRVALRAAAAEHDLILTSGGVSVGDEDHIKPALRAEGELDLWKIAIKPGKPLAFGRVNKTSGSAAFIGLPGNPVAAFTTFLMLVRPFILHCQGVRQTAPTTFYVPAGFSWPKPDKRREFLRARLGEDGRLTLYPNQGSGVLSSAAWADGLVDLPPATAVLEGDRLCFYPFSELLS